MINRREIMASGIAVTVLGPASRASGAAHSAAIGGAGPSVFIADAHVPAARAAARAAHSLGVPSRALAADVTPVYAWLDLALRAAPVTIAGCTTPQALFALERLAWDRGLRTVYRGVHRHQGKAAPADEFLGSPAIVGRIRRIDDRDWGAGLARVLATAAPGPADGRHIVTSQWLPQAHDRVLVSWLLAPRAALGPRMQSASVRA